MQGIYVLHFDKPVPYEKANQYGDNQHYVGKAADMDKRIWEHQTGGGSNMTKVAINNEINFRVAAIFPGPTTDARERLIQNNVKTLCPCYLNKPVEEVKVNPAKKASVTSLINKEVKKERVEYATPFTLRFSDYCDRCDKPLAASSSGAKVNGETVCLDCVLPAEAGRKLAHLFD